MNPTGMNLGLLEHLLNAAGLRHRVISQNVANVNTPGYKRLEVAFDSSLAKALSGGSGGPVAAPRIQAGSGPERVDGNTVDIDVEMNDLVKNAVLYQAAAQVASNRIAAMRSAIAGR